MTEFWNPITSTGTKLVETRPDGVRIYADLKGKTSGKFIVVRDWLNWVSVETLEQARLAIL